jgi:AmmeMemoRadiSam system protein A
VTLRHSGALRGCVGALDPLRALVCDVAHNAYGAAFRDSRFPALRADELAELKLQISVLSPLEPLDVHSEQALLARLEPGVDGLVLADGERRGTFLPSVWEQLPSAPDFLRELKRKAGLPAQGWSPAYRVWRYTTESFE